MPTEKQIAARNEMKARIRQSIETHRDERSGERQQARKHASRQRPSRRVSKRTE